MLQGAYVAPAAEVLTIETEQCFAASQYGTRGNDIQDALEDFYGDF